MKTSSHPVTRRRLGMLLMLAAISVGGACISGGARESLSPAPVGNSVAASPTPPPSTTSSVTPAQAADATSLLILATELISSAAPLLMVEDLQLADCPGGSIAYTYDGAPAAVGSSVGLGSHTLGATFNDCNVDGVLYVGGSSVAQYRATAKAPMGSTGLAGTATVVNDELNWVSTHDNVTWSVVASGTFHSTRVFTTNPNTGLSTDRVEVGSTSATLVNHTNDSGQAATLTGGTVTLIAGYRASDRALLGYGLEYRDLSFQLGGVNYTIRGSEAYTMGDTGPAAATGHIEILANGVVSATAVPKLPGGWTITSVTGPVGPW